MKMFSQQHFLNKIPEEKVTHSKAEQEKQLAQFIMERMKSNSTRIFYKTRESHSVLQSHKYSSQHKCKKNRYVFVVDYQQKSCRDQIVMPQFVEENYKEDIRKIVQEKRKIFRMGESHHLLKNKEKNNKLNRSDLIVYPSKQQINRQSMLSRQFNPSMATNKKLYVIKRRHTKHEQQSDMRKSMLSGWERYEENPSCPTFFTGQS